MSSVHAYPIAACASHLFLLFRFRILIFPGLFLAEYPDQPVVSLANLASLVSLIHNIGKTVAVQISADRNLGENRVKEVPSVQFKQEQCSIGLCS